MRSAHNESADHDVVADVHESARRDVRRIRRRALVQIVKLHDANASRAAGAAHDRGVIARLKCRDDCGFLRISRRNGAVDDLLFLRAVHPIVIRGKRVSRAIEGQATRRVHVQNFEKVQRAGRERPGARQAHAFIVVVDTTPSHEPDRNRKVRDHSRFGHCDLHRASARAVACCAGGGHV